MMRYRGAIVQNKDGESVPQFEFDIEASSFVSLMGKLGHMLDEHGTAMSFNHIIIVLEEVKSHEDVG